MKQSIFDRIGGADKNLASSEGFARSGKSRQRYEQGVAQGAATRAGLGQAGSKAWEGVVQTDAAKELGSKALQKASNIFADKVTTGAVDAGTSMVADTAASTVADGAIEAGTGLVADTAASTGTSLAGGLANGLGTGLASSGTDLGLQALGVDEETSEYGGLAAGLAASAMLGGPAGMAAFAGSKLIEKGAGK